MHTYNPSLEETRQGNYLELETILAYVARPVWGGKKRRKNEIGGYNDSAGKGVYHRSLITWTWSRGRRRKLLPQVTLCTYPTTCIHVHCACICVHVYVCMHMYVYMYIVICVRAHVFIITNTLHICHNMHTCALYMYVYVYMCIMHAYVCMGICACTHFHNNK